MKPILLFCISLLAATDTLATDDAQVIESMLHRFLAGVSAGDRSVHEWFWADDLVYTSSSGQRFGKAEILAPVDTAEGGDAASPLPVYQAQAVNVRIYDSAAVLAFMLVSRAPGEGAEPAAEVSYFNTGTLLKRAGTWSVVAWQATRIPDPVAP